MLPDLTLPFVQVLLIFIFDLHISDLIPLLPDLTFKLCNLLPDLLLLFVSLTDNALKFLALLIKLLHHLSVILLGHRVPRSFFYLQLAQFQNLFKLCIHFIQLLPLLFV